MRAAPAPVETSWGEGVQVIAFDADDTLWHSEDLFSNAHGALADSLGMPRGRLEDELGAVEARNLATLGFGAKSFALSAVEYLVSVAPVDRLPALIGEVLEHTRGMLDGPVRLLDGPAVFATLAALRERGHVVGLVTKGDYLVQSARLRESGLEPAFDRISVVAEKNEETYREVFTGWGVDPAAVCMVGNSVRSDVLPVLALGGRAVHIPYPHVWQLEAAELPATPRVLVREALAQLLDVFPTPPTRGPTP